MNILKLAKNLREFTLDEIEMLAEFNCEMDLKELLKAQKIEFKNGFYKYVEPKETTVFELVAPPKFKKGERILFKDIANAYLANRKLTKETLKGYISPLKMSITPHFGELFLDEITYEMIKDFMQDLQKKYKPKSVSNAITLLGSILKWAFDEGLCKTNPYYGIKNPSIWRKVKK